MDRDKNRETFWAWRANARVHVTQKPARVNSCQLASQDPPSQCWVGRSNTGALDGYSSRFLRGGHFLDHQCVATLRWGLPGPPISMLSWKVEHRCARWILQLFLAWRALPRSPVCSNIEMGGGGRGLGRRELQMSRIHNCEMGAMPFPIIRPVHGSAVCRTELVDFFFFLGPLGPHGPTWALKNRIFFLK